MIQATLEFAGLPDARFSESGYWVPQPRDLTECFVETLLGSRLSFAAAGRKDPGSPALCRSAVVAAIDRTQRV